MINQEQDFGCSSNNDNRIKRLIDLWWNADTIIGKIFKFVYDSEVGVNELKLKNYIKSLNGIERTWYTDLHTSKKDYCLIFIRDNNRITKISEEANVYIKTKL